MFGLELTRAVELILFLGVVHFGVEVNLRNLQRLVPEPTLNFHEVEAGPQPVGSRSLPEPVKVMLLANGPALACYFDFMAVVVSALTNQNFTLAAIQPRTLCDCFELAKEVAFRFPIFVRKNPALGHGMLFVIGQQRT
jgi:hypothetical protein